MLAPWEFLGECRFSKANGFCLNSVLNSAVLSTCFSWFSGACYFANFGFFLIGLRLCFICFWWVWVWYLAYWVILYFGLYCLKAC